MKPKAPFRGLGYQGRNRDDEAVPPTFSWFPVVEVVCIVAIVGFFAMIFNR